MRAAARLEDVDGLAEQRLRLSVLAERAQQRAELGGGVREAKPRDPDLRADVRAGPAGLVNVLVD